MPSLFGPPPGAVSFANPAVTVGTVGAVMRVIESVPLPTFPAASVARTLNGFTPSANATELKRNMPFVSAVTAGPSAPSRTVRPGSDFPESATGLSVVLLSPSGAVSDAESSWSVTVGAMVSSVNPTVFSCDWFPARSRPRNVS